MEAFGARVPILVLLHLLLLILVVSIYCEDEEDHLLQGINSFRQSSNIPPLAKHDNANCVADEIADSLEDRQCASNTGPPTQSQLTSDYPNVIKKCNGDANSTSDGIILPVCVPRRVATLVLTNYTQSQNARYLNNSRYTGVGIGTEDDWTVLVLTTGTPAGSFANGACFSRMVGLSYYDYLSSLFMIFFLQVLIY